MRGQICYEAFDALAAAHGFPSDFLSAKVAPALAGMMLGHPGFYSLVAEVDGQVVGSNFLDERSPIVGIGPITVAPAAQDDGIGRALMNGALVRPRCDIRSSKSKQLHSAYANSMEITMGTKLNGLLSRVEEVVTALIAAWNSDNIDVMFRLFAPDAHWVNIVGMHWRGREAVEHAHRVYFDLMFKGVDQRLEEIESVIALPGGVAVAVVRIHMESFRQPDGVVRPAGRDRLTLVLVPDGQGLLIAHGSNVGIVEEAQQFDPTLRR